MAGLLAARVLADHFNEVVIIDPDNDLLTARAKASLPSAPGMGKVDTEAGRQPRTRVMQARAIHGTQSEQLSRRPYVFPSYFSSITLC